MILIDTPLAMAKTLATIRNPWLSRRLALYRERLHEADCEVGELGPVGIIETGDTLTTIEATTGLSLEYGPEYCESDHGWNELAFITGDDGSGLVLFIPAREGIDPALLAFIPDANADALREGSAAGTVKAENLSLG